MAGFVCEVELNLHLLSSIGNHDCPGQWVYLSVEMFGTVHKTKPQHSYYPLIFNEIINFQKKFYSPVNENEVLDMLEDSSVIIELRRLDPCFYTGLLLSYYDGNTKEFLFSRYPRIPCSINGQEIYLDRTVDFNVSYNYGFYTQGTAPRLRYSVFADVKKITPSLESFNTVSKFIVNNRSSDDGYHSPTQIPDNSFQEPTRQSRSRKVSYDSGSIENVSNSKPMYTRQTVSSALRSRSPSPIMNKSNDYRDDLGTKDNEGLFDECDKPPFVVRKVPDCLITRTPKLHDNTVRSNSRRGRSKRRVSPNKGKTVTPYDSAERRFRSASPSRRSNFDANVESYKPSTVLSSLRSTYEIPHYCCNFSTLGRCHSPLLDYYANKIAKLSCVLPNRHHCCYSHYSHW